MVFCALWMAMVMATHSTEETMPQETMPQVTELLELEPDQLPADAIDQINQAQSVAQSAQQQSNADAMSAISAAMANTAAATKESQDRFNEAKREELAAIEQVNLAKKKEEELKRTSEGMDQAVAKSKKQLNDVRIKNDQTKIDFLAAQVEHDAARDEAASAKAEAEQAQAEAARAQKLAESGNPMTLKAQKATQEANLKADDANQKAKNAADSVARVVQTSEEQSKTTTELSQLAGKAQQAVVDSEAQQSRLSDLKQAETTTKHTLELQEEKTAEVEERAEVAQKAEESLKKKVLAQRGDFWSCKHFVAG